MKITFNDTSELVIQSATIRTDGSLLIKTISATEEELRTAFSDEFRTKKMIITERESTVAEYEGYTNLNALVKYTGGILGVVLYKKEEAPEVKKELQNAAIMVVQIQAQSLTDTQALTVQDIYPEWSGDGVEYAKDHKVRHNDNLYKCIQIHTSQSDWAPGTAPSLWTALADPTTTGTKEDPIQVPETVTTAGMEYVRGKYYSYNEKVYLMKRQGMSDGDSVILYFTPDQLVGQYFEEV